MLEDPYGCDYEHEYDRDMKRRWRAVHILALVLFVFALGGVVVAYAQVPPAQHPKECEVIAEMVLTARALDKHGITGDKAHALMADFYQQLLTGPHGERAAKYVMEGLKLAARAEYQKLSPFEVGERVEAECRKNEGDLSSVFGTGS